MTRVPLTARQREVLEYLTDFISVRGYPPSFGELEKWFGRRCDSHVVALERKGWIERDAGRNRAIRVL